LISGRTSNSLSPVTTAVLRHVLLGLVVLAAMLLPGCGRAVRYHTPERVRQGYTIILPGIEGASYLNANIAKGLVNGGVPSSIEVYDWTASAFLFPVNLRNYARNQREARKVARKIMTYQDANPGKPVHLIGHSGGGGIAVMALEALPANRTVTSAILLAPAVAPTYDLRRSMRRTQYGIWNYHSPYDMGFLGAGTTIMGTIEGRHTRAAGAVGFDVPSGLNEEERQLYSTRLHQQRYTRRMADSGHGGGHTGWANSGFVAQWLAPLVNSQIEAQARFAADTAPQRPRSPRPSP
jgi:pimeloyl-ACP methyl ester carboxylesterase